MEGFNHLPVSSEVTHLDLPIVDGFASPRSPHSKGHVGSLTNGPKSSDDDVFHHLAMQLSLIDIGHRDGSKPATPEPTHSPINRYSPDPATIDLTQYSGIATNITSTEAASNKYFEYSRVIDDNSSEEVLPSEKRQRSTLTAENINSVQRSSGICTKLEYPRVKITGEKDIADFAGVSIIVFMRVILSSSYG